MSLTPLEKAMSGALASAIANTLVYPLDLSKTLIQTQVHTRRTSGIALDYSSSEDSDQLQQPKTKRELKYKNTVDVLKQIYKKRGVLGWYHGLSSSIFGTATQNFSYFYWYTIVRRIYTKLHRSIPNHKPTTAMELFLGALAAAISQLFTMPIGVITTHQQTDKSHKNLCQLTKEILEHDGITGLWRGLKVSMVLCINPSITYGSYERLRQILFADKKYLGPLESFSLGVLAKSLATICTQPLIVSKAMLQKKIHNTSKDSKHALEDEEDMKFERFTEALKHLWDTEHFRGLYKGIAPQLLKGVFVQGMLFMFKDQIDMIFMMILHMLKSRKLKF